jgi:hypothetical protein
MRKLLLILALLVPSLTWAGTCGNGYSFSQQLIVKHNLVANSTTLTNFPYLVPFNGAATSSITLTALKTVANSGSIQNTAANSAGVTGPADFIVCDAASAGNAIKFEIAQYTATSGKMELWVQIASLSNSADQNIWIFYGNAGVVATQQDLSMWTDASYVGIFHMADGTTLSATDSTATLTAAKVGSPTATTGIVDGAMGSVSAANYINITQNAAMRVASTLTVEGWGNPTSCANFGTIVSVPYATSGWASPFQSWTLNTYSTNCQSRFVVTNSGTSHPVDNQGQAMNLNQWNQLVGTFDGTTVRSYLNGLQSGTASFTGTITYPVNADVAIGQRGTYSTGDAFAGSIDEVRIASVTKTADWIKTEYSNATALTTQLYVAPSPVTNCGTGYLFSREIRLRRATGSDQTNYPFLLSLDYASLKTVANGGQVQNTAANALSRTGPADLQFCPDNTGTSNALKYEVVTYSATAGTMGAWVQIPTLHSASTDSIYMYLNNSGQSASQQDLTMWSDINCTAIWHYPDGVTLDAKDSCPTNSLNGTVNGTTAASSSVINGSVSFPGSAGNNITFGSTNNYVDPARQFSVSFWGKTNFVGGSIEFPQFLILHQRAVDAMNIGYASPSNGSYNGFYWGQTNGESWGRFHDNVSLDTNYYNFSSMSYNGADPTASGSFSTTRNGVSNSITTAGNFGATTNENKISQSTTATSTWQGQIDEARIFADLKAANWNITDFQTQSGSVVSATAPWNWKAGPYLVVETPPATPYVRQWTTCNTDYFSSTCTFAAPLLNGTTLVMLVSYTDTLCSLNTPSDSLTLTYTLRASAKHIGTLHDYEPCIFTAPVTSSAFDTITLPFTNTAAVIYEVGNMTTSGLVTATDNGAAPPAALSATSPGANSFLICGTRNTVSGSIPPILPTTSEGYSFYQTAYNGGASDHGSVAYSAYGVVGTGTQSCTLSSGDAAVMAIFGYSAPATAVRHRVNNF